MHPRRVPWNLPGCTNRPVWCPPLPARRLRQAVEMPRRPPTTISTSVSTYAHRFNDGYRFRKKTPIVRFASSPLTRGTDSLGNVHQQIRRRLPQWRSPSRWIVATTSAPGAAIRPFDDRDRSERDFGLREGPRIPAEPACLGDIEFGSSRNRCLAALGLAPLTHERALVSTCVRGAARLGRYRKCGLPWSANLARTIPSRCADRVVAFLGGDRSHLAACPPESSVPLREPETDPGCHRDQRLRCRVLLARTNVVTVV